MTTKNQQKYFNDNLTHFYPKMGQTKGQKQPKKADNCTKKTGERSGGAKSKTVEDPKDRNSVSESELEIDERHDSLIRTPVRKLARKVAYEMENDKSFTEHSSPEQKDTDKSDKSFQDAETGKQLTKLKEGVQTRSRSKLRVAENTEILDKDEHIVAQITQSQTNKTNTVSNVVDTATEPQTSQDVGKKRKHRNRSPSSSSSSGTSSSSDSDSERDRYRKNYRKSRTRNKRSKKRSKKSHSYSRSRSRSVRRRSKGKRRKYHKYESDSDSEDLFQKRVNAAVAEQLRKIQQSEGGHKNSPGKIKSTSDSDLYTPAVKRINRPSASPVYIEKDTDTNSINIDQLNAFLQQMRVKSVVAAAAAGSEDQQATDAGSPSKQNNDYQEAVPDKETVNKAVIDAERYKATLHMQPGTVRNYPSNDNDDDFFYVSCHVDSAMAAKCSQGDFVDLDKLLAKICLDRNNREEKLDIIKRDGHSYLVTTPDRDNKIVNIKRWDQAFRIYAALYSKANPHRAAEIWQYVHVIHTAAAAYKWDNVSFYDITFRHLMAANPTRSWAKTYTQGWSLAMRDPLPRQEQHSYSTYNNTSKSHDKSPAGVCWRYNKNKCKYGPNCRFEHRCSYCGGNHPVINCFKKQNGGGNKKYTGDNKEDKDKKN